MIEEVTSADSGSIEGWVPRGLINDGNAIISANVTEEGLCPLRIYWKCGKIIKIEVCFDREIPNKMILPRFVEPHAHIDKGYSWSRFPNLKSTYQAALEVNLEEHRVRTVSDVMERSETALDYAFSNGIRALRTHIDSFGIGGTHSWEVISELKKKWHRVIDIQCVALVPLDYWSSGEGQLLATKVSTSRGYLGGVLAPPFDEKKNKKDLKELIFLAERLGCGIDIHIDESSSSPGKGINFLLKILDENMITIPITCSHSSSMGLLSPKKIRHLAERMADHQINVIALPLTNYWLLGRKEKSTPTIRPLAPIKQLQEAGVTVAIGSDNVQDAWFPIGNLNPLSLMSHSMPLIQMAPWERACLSAFTTCPANLMDLDWDGSISKESPASFVIVKGSSWSEALSHPSEKEHIINGIWTDKKMSQNKLGD